MPPSPPPPPRPPSSSANPARSRTSPPQQPPPPPPPTEPLPRASTSASLPPLSLPLSLPGSSSETAREEEELTAIAAAARTRRNQVPSYGHLNALRALTTRQQQNQQQRQQQRRSSSANEAVLNRSSHSTLDVTFLKGSDVPPHTHKTAVHMYNSHPLLYSHMHAHAHAHAHPSWQQQQQQQQQRGRSARKRVRSLTETQSPAYGTEGMTTLRAAAEDEELEERWARVKSGLDEVARRINSDVSASRTSPSRWVKMYTEVAALYAQSNGDRKRRMFMYVRQFLREFVREQLLNLLPLSGVQLLSEYVRRWKMSVLFASFMRRVLHHLHRFWIPSNLSHSKQDPVCPIDRLLIFYWREELLSKLHGLIDIVLQLIDEDRRERIIDDAIIKGILENLVALGGEDCLRVERPPPNRKQRTFDTAPTTSTTGTASLFLYIQIFEHAFLRRTRAFYEAEAEYYMRVNCVSTFMRSVAIRLHDEMGRGMRLLHPDSMERLSAVVEEQLIGAHMDYLHREAEKMVREANEEQLTLLYRLLHRMEGGLAPVRAMLTQQVIAEGTNIIKSHESALEESDDMRKTLPVVQDLINLYRVRMSMVYRCFGSSSPFVTSVDFAFRSFINKPLGTRSMPEVLAFYADHLLREHCNVLEKLHISNDLEALPFGKFAGPEIPPLRSIPPRPEPHPSRTVGSFRGVVSDSFCRLPPPGEPVCMQGPLTPISELLKQPPMEESKLIEPFVQHLDNVIRLFVYLDDKDVFCESYRRLFAKRLLGKHNEDMEREFISKLKVEMGPVFTSKLSGMLHDISISNDVRRNFAQSFDKSGSEYSVEIRRNAKKQKISGAMVCGKLTKVNFEFNAHVLNALYWPAFPSDTLRVPIALEACEQKFAEFYLGAKEPRKLTWLHQQSTTHLGARFRTRNYTLVMSTFQACALLLFNHASRITLSEMSNELNVSAEQLRQHLLPLVAGKRVPLLFAHKESENSSSDGTNCDEEEEIGEGEEDCSPETNTLEDSPPEGEPATIYDVRGPSLTSDKKRTFSRDASETIYELNENFRSKHFRINIPASVVRMSCGDSSSARQSVVVDRSPQIDAALVRTMKTRKRLSHNELIAEVMKQVAPVFKPVPKIIKVRLERLIEREFIERDPQCSNTYLYCT